MDKKRKAGLIKRVDALMVQLDRHDLHLAACRLQAVRDALLRDIQLEHLPLSFEDIPGRRLLN